VVEIGFRKMPSSLNPRRVHMHDRTSGRSPDLSLYVDSDDVSFPLKPSHAFAQWRKIGKEKNQKAFTVAGPCGNYTRFPLHPLPEYRQQGPEAKAVLLRRRVIYTEQCVKGRSREGREGREGGEGKEGGEGGENYLHLTLSPLFPSFPSLPSSVCSVLSLLTLPNFLLL
jgi:hypothetical protein